MRYMKQTNGPRLRPFFRYYGSKFTLAPKYPKPQYDTIIEPFAGSAQYATLYYDRNVILWESNPEVFQLWKWLIGVDPAVIRALPYDLPVGLDIRELDVPLGAQLLIRASQRVGRSFCWTVSKWNGRPGMWSERMRDRTAAQVSAIRHWQCHHMHALVAPPHLAPHVATWFVDPPYQTQPTVYGNRPLDYPRMARWCRSLPGQVIVCEAPGANWLPFEHLAMNTAGGGREGTGRPRRAELVWTKT